MKIKKYQQIDIMSFDIAANGVTKPVNISVDSKDNIELSIGSFSINFDYDDLEKIESALNDTKLFIQERGIREHTGQQQLPFESSNEFNSKGIQHSHNDVVDW